MKGENITDCELLVMKILWDTTEELSLPGIVDAVNTAFDRTWKPQTVSTFLARLVRKGYLDMVRKGRLFIYYPKVSKKEYATIVIGNYVEFYCENDASRIVENMMDVRKLTKEESEKIKALIG